MLALQLCGVALTFLSALPTPLWSQVTEAAYGCPVSLVQTSAVRGLRPLEQARRGDSGTWRVIELSQLQDARRGDGVRLPAQPTALFWRPHLRQQLQRAQAQGTYLVLDLPELRQLPALATTYAGWGLKPDAALLQRAPAHWNDLPAGTFLLSEVGGVELLPRVARLGQVQLVPYLPRASSGSYASPDVPATTLKLSPTLGWTYAGQTFGPQARAAPPSWGTRTLVRLMPLVWAVGWVLNTPRASLIYTASGSVAWLGLALLVLTLLALGRALLRATARR